VTSEKRPENQHKDDLERLQELLLDDDRSRLNELDQRISGFENRVTDVAEVLPTAFKRIASDPALETGIEKPVLHSIRTSIKRDPQELTELLFPIMGPAIRRAVADALKSLVQRINVAMEHSFSIKGLRWRLESARSGVPFGQVVLSHTMRYSVQETFLIARETGLVLAHAHRDENLVLDEDAVAAMLTAIQSFIQDSLGMGADEPLRSAELGDRTLWVINGPEAILACVISGTPPRPVRDELMALLESIHARYGERFGENNDTLMADMGLRTLVQQSLREELDDSHKPGSSSKAKFYWLALIALIAVLIGWKSWQAYQQREYESRIVRLFENQPGYVVSSSNREASEFVIHGLRDPGTPSPQTILAGQGLADTGVQFRLKPFWSLEPALVVQRLRSSLQLADSTTLELQDGVLRVSGVLNTSQSETLYRLAAFYPIIDSVELSEARLSADDAIQLARQRLDAPDSVLLSANGEQIVVDGLSSIDWYLEKSPLPSNIGGWGVTFQPLLTNLQNQLGEEARKLEKVNFFFTSRDRLTPESAAAIEIFAKRFKTFIAASESLGATPSITLVGEADGTGTAEQNSRIARARVKVVQDLLIGAGIPPDRIDVDYPPWRSGGENMEQRRVSLRMDEGDTS
jgi:OOP family OmpA-OmpF porin